MALQKRKPATSYMTAANVMSFIGKRVKVRTSTGYAGMNVGQTVKIVNISSPNSLSASFIIEGVNSAGWIALNYTTFESATETREDIAAYKEQLKQDQKEIDQEMNLADAKLAFLAETGESSIDDKTFKLYHVMKTMDKDASHLEKAKMLADLMN